jgi:NTE family protein
MTWLAEQERAHRYMVYACPPQPGAWARRCMRQTDRILLVIRAEDLPVMTPMVDELLRSGTQAVVEVLVLRAPAAPVADILGWRRLVRANSHRYLAPQDAADVPCLARGLCGRGIGLVLGGGGARGFAHLGLMRALEELQIPVDLFGGSSMGAFFAALRACGRDVDSMIDIARQSFVEHNFLNDYLFPSVALVRGRKFVRRLHDIFGEQPIETLPRPFFCVSSNLTRGQVEVHDSGPLYLWTATSMAVPGVAPPVVWREELLVDGALLNSLPVDIMQSLQRGPVIASDVSTGGELRALGIEGPDPEGLFNWQGPGKRPSLFNIMFRTATVGGQQDAKARAKLADVYLRMPVGGVALFDWKRFDEVIEQGYEHALEQLAPLRDFLLGGDL